MNNHQAVIDGIIPAHTHQEKDCLIEHLKNKVKRYEDALHFIQSQAGIPDAADACRQIIKTAREALEEK